MALRLIFRKRRGLPKAGAPGCVELLLEALVLSLQAIAFALGARQLLAQARDFVVLPLDQIVAIVARRTARFICHTVVMADSRRKYKYGILDPA